MLIKSFSKREIQQGVLVESVEFNIGTYNKNLPSVCLTPACDLAVQEDGQRNADFVLFCGLVLDESFFSELLNRKVREKKLTSIVELPKKDKDAVISQISDIVVKDRNQRYYWIFNKYTNKGLIADFQIVKIEDFQTANKHKKKYKLVSSYMERIATKYGSYMGRIGTQDIDRKSHFERLKAYIDTMS